MAVGTEANIGEPPSLPGPAAATDGAVLNVYNWSDYIDPQVLQDFGPDVNPDAPAMGAYRKNKF